MPLDDTDLDQQDYQDQLDGIQTGITPVTRSYTPPSRSVSPGMYHMSPRPRPISTEDPSEDDPSRPSFTFRPPDNAIEDHDTHFSDYAKTAWNGARSMGSDLMGAAAYATQQLSSDPHAGQMFRDAQQSLETDIEKSVQSMSPAAQKALHASLFSNDPNAPSPGEVGWGRYLGLNIASQVPMLLSFVIPSTIGAKIMLTAAKYAGTAAKAVEAATAAGKTAEEIAAAGKAALGTAASRGGMAGSGAFFGAQGAGAVYNDIVSQVGKASDAEMMQAPGYAENRQNGMGIVEAKERVIQQSASLLVAAGGVVGAVAGAGVSGTLVHGALGTAGRGAIARTAIGAAEGGALMGGQGAANEALSQGAGIQTGLRKDFDPAQIAREFASGAIPGMVFGAAGGFFHKGPKGIDDTRTTGQVPPDEGAALKEALGPPPPPEQFGPPPPAQGQLDLGQAPTGIPTGLAQGEMFPTTQEVNAPSARMTGEPTPPPQPMNTPTMGMPGARQGELPINQAPPTIVPTTGQGEMFPSLAEANPPRRPGEPPVAAQQAVAASKGTAAAPAAMSAEAQSAATAGLTPPPTGPVDTAKVAASGTTTRKPTAGAAKTAIKAVPADIVAMRKPDLIDELMQLTGQKRSKFESMNPQQLGVWLHNERQMRGIGEEEAPAGPKLAGAEAPAESLPTVTPGVESKPAIGEKPLPDQPGASITPQAEVTPADVRASTGETAAGVTPSSKDADVRRRELAAQGHSPIEVNNIMAKEMRARSGLESGAAPAPEGRGFTTAKGSTYTLHDDGTTTRDKAYRPEHGIDEQGVQPRSEKTIYVSAEDAQKLGSDFQSQGGSSRVIAQHSSGAWGVRYTAGKDAGKFERRTMVKPLDGPAVGAIPVELWNKGKRAHFGNEITEMRGEVTPEVKPKVEAKPAPTKLAALMEKREQKREELPPGTLTAPKAAAEAAKAKLPEAKPVDTEALAKAKATRDEEVKAAEKARKEADAEKAKKDQEIRKEKALDLLEDKKAAEAGKVTELREALGERYAVETEHGAKAAEAEDRIAETSGSTTALEGMAEHRTAERAKEGAVAGQEEAPPPSEQDIVDAQVARDKAAEAQGRVATQSYGEGTGEAKELAPGTTDRKRIQNNLVDQVAKGDLTGPAAHAKYEAGRREDGGGAKRTPGYDTLAEGLVRRLAESKIPGAEKMLREQLSKLELEKRQDAGKALKDRKRTNVEYTRQIRDLSAALEHFHPEHIENLENALREINDPVGHAAEQAAHPETSPVERHLKRIEAGSDTRNVLRAIYEIAALPHDETLPDREARILDRRGLKPEDVDNINTRIERTPAIHRDKVDEILASRHGERGTLRQGGVSPEGLPNPFSSRYVRMANDPRLHEDLRRDIRASEEHGVDYTPKAALETILRSSALKTEQRPLWELAKKLYDRVNDSIPIISFGEAQRRGYRSIHYNLESGERGTHGYYDHTGARSDGVRHIGINMDTPVTGQTLLHEIAHSVTTDRLNHLLRTDPNHREIHALRTIATELANHARLNRETVDPAVWQRLVHATGDVRETHTWLMTNPEVQAFAASHQASPQFRKIMAELGYTPRPHGNSIWRYFVDWTRHALGFDKPKSASEYTLLDHIMQPVTDILDASIKHNEGIRSSDPIVRAHAEPLLHASTDRLRDTGRSVLERIRPSNLPDRLFNAVTGATNVDAITSLHKDTLPGLVDYQRVRDKIAKAGTDTANKYGDRVRGLLKTWGGLSDQKELGSLMNRASLGEMHLGDNLPADANKHLTTPEQLAELKQGQADYAKLSPAAKGFYGDARDLYKETYKESREAELEGSLRAVIPDVTDAQAEAFTQAARNKETLTKFMADPDNSEIAKAFGDKWSENRDLAKMIARAHSYGYTQGDYFPQRRYGKYVVKYGTGDNQGVEFFDRKSKAEDRRAELVKQYGDKDVFQVTRHNQKFTQDILATHPAVGELESALTRKGLSAKQAELARDTLAGILVNHMADGQAARMRLKRQGIPGASIDHARVLSHEFINHTNRIGYLRHGAERQATFDNLWAQQRDLERPGAKPDLGNKMAMVIQSLEKRIQRPEDMNNSAQRNLAHVNAFNYVLSLMSPSHMVTATMEAHTNSIALLAGRHGVIRSSAAVARNLAKAAPILGKSPNAMLSAMRHDLSASNWNVLDMLAKRFRDMPGANKALVDAVHKMLAATGLVDHTMTSDLRRQMNPEGVFGGKVAGMWERVSDTNQIMAHYVDAINRFVSAYSAAELEHAKTKGDIGKSVDYAEKTARRVAPNYMAGNRELLTSAKGPLGMLGAPLMQFKRYGLHMYAMMGTLIKESMRSGTSAERWEARKSLAYLMASHAMMAGVLGLPTTDAIRYLGGAWDLIHGRDPHNYENSMRAAIAHVVGPQMGELISRGLPHALGFDVHRRVSLNNLMEMPELSNFGKKGITEALMHLVTGATGENLANVMEGAGKLAQLDYGGLKNLLPRVVRDPMKAIQLASKGVTDSKGQTILPPSKLSYGDYALQAAGFQPARVSEFREGRNAVLEARQEQSAERSQLETRWMEGSPSERASAWQAIVAYNATHPTARITRDQLLQQEKAGKKSGATMGLRLPKKGAAALMQAGSFANAN